MDSELITLLHSYRLPKTFFGPILVVVMKDCSVLILQIFFHKCPYYAKNCYLCPYSDNNVLIVIEKPQKCPYFAKNSIIK